MTSNLKGLGSRAIIGAFQKRLAEVQAASWVQQLALQIDSNQESENYQFLGDAPTMTEHVGGPRPFTTLQPFEFTVRNKRFTAGLQIDEDDLRRDKTGQILIRARELGARAAVLPQKILSSLMVANSNAYDGVAFFHATNHVTKNGDVVDNAIQVTAAAGTTPTNAEMETAVLSAVEKILSWKDDAGEPRNEDAQSFMVHVPTVMWKQLKGALKNDYVSSGVSNTLKSTEFEIVPVMNGRLAAPYIYVFRTDADVKPFVWQDEVAPMMEPLAEGTEYAKLNLHHLYLAKRICNGGFGRFDQACRVEFT